jgi:hypothetical protein
MDITIRRLLDAGFSEPKIKAYMDTNAQSLSKSDLDYVVANDSTGRYQSSHFSLSKTELGEPIAAPSFTNFIACGRRQDGKA